MMDDIKALARLHLNSDVDALAAGERLNIDYPVAYACPHYDFDDEERLADRYGLSVDEIAAMVACEWRHMRDDYNQHVEERICGTP